MAGKDFAFIVSAELQLSVHHAYLCKIALLRHKKKKKTLKALGWKNLRDYGQKHFMHANIDTNVYSMHYNHAVLLYKRNVHFRMWLHEASELKCMIGNVRVII